MAKIAPVTPAIAVPSMTTASTAAARILTARPITMRVTIICMTAAISRLTTSAGSTTAGARTRAKAGSTAQPSNGPMKGMNWMRPAMTAMSGGERDTKEEGRDRRSRTPKISPIRPRPRMKPPNDRAMARSSAAMSA